MADIGKVASEGPLSKFVPGVTAAVSQGPGAAVTKAVDVSRDVSEVVRGVGNDGTKTSGKEVVVTEASVNGNQPATTPTKKNPTSLETDSYRNGNQSYNGDTGDSLINTRVLGEPDQDTLAYISISTEIEGDLAKYINSQKYENNMALGHGAERTTLIQGDKVTAYTRFFLQQVSESQQEKYQVVETFTSFYTFFYGKRPTVYTFTGSLLNDENHKWVNDFMFFYDNFFRGTRTADMGAQAVMTYDGRVVSGFIIDLAIRQSAELHKGAQFSMNMLVTDHVPINFSVDITALIEKAQIDLINEKARIMQQVGSINKNVPAEVAQAANAKVGGLAPMASVRTGRTTRNKIPSKKKKGFDKYW